MSGEVPRYKGKQPVYAFEAEVGSASMAKKCTGDSVLADVLVSEPLYLLNHQMYILLDQGIQNLLDERKFTCKHWHGSMLHQKLSITLADPAKHNTA